MKLIFHNSLATNTRASYNSGIKQFIHFCLHYRQFTSHNSILPASEDTLLLFATFLSQHVTPATTKVYLCAVRHLHIESGLPSPTEHLHRLPYLLRGIKRLYSQERRVRLPITPSILLSFCTRLNFQWHDHIMLWTAMLVAFFAFLRSAELIALTVSDLSTCNSTTHSLPTYILSIRASKSDPFRQGCQVRLSPSGHPTLCPAKALTNYLRITHLSHSSPLFVWSSGNPLCRATLTNCIKWLAASTGINEHLYSLHSFRIGAATTASAAGLPDSLIKTMGRWSSDAYQSYIRTPLSLLDSVAPAMANHNS